MGEFIAFPFEEPSSSACRYKQSVAAVAVKKRQAGVSHSVATGREEIVSPILPVAVNIQNGWSLRDQEWTSGGEKHAER